MISGEFMVECMNPAIKSELLPASTPETCSLANCQQSAVRRITAPIRLDFGMRPGGSIAKLSLSLGSREFSLYLCRGCEATLTELLNQKES
jgi:hypothetical protein